MMRTQLTEEPRPLAGDPEQPQSGITGPDRASAPLSRAVLMGPGPRSREVGGVLGVLASTRCARASGERTSGLPVGLWLDDLGDLLAGDLDRRAWTVLGIDMEVGRAHDGQGECGAGTLVLEADLVPLEDIGIVRRFLESRPTWSLLLLAEHPARQEAQALRNLPRASLLVWPPDLEQLAQVLVPSQPDADEAPRSGAPPQSLPRSADTPAPGGLPEPGDDAPAGGASQAIGGWPAGEESPPLPAGKARDSGPGASSGAAPGGAVGPLFTELGGLVEELLAGDALTVAGSPRYLFRSEGIYPVVGERQALAANLSGLLGLARHAAGDRGVVSVLVGPLADGHGVLLRIEFPPGSLAGLNMEELLQRTLQDPPDPTWGPQGTRDDLGQALADAARAADRLRGAGAEPSLCGLEDGRLRLAVEFPPLPAGLTAEVPGTPSD